MGQFRPTFCPAVRAVSLAGARVRKAMETQGHLCAKVCWNSTLLAKSHANQQHQLSIWLQTDMQDSSKIKKSEADCLLMNNDKEITVTRVSVVSAFSLTGILFQKKHTSYNTH